MLMRNNNTMIKNWQITAKKSIATHCAIAECQGALEQENFEEHKKDEEVKKHGRVKKDDERIECGTTHSSTRISMYIHTCTCLNTSRKTVPSPWATIL